MDFIAYGAVGVFVVFMIYKMIKRKKGSGPTVGTGNSSKTTREK